MKRSIILVVLLAAGLFAGYHYRDRWMTPKPPVDDGPVAATKGPQLVVLVVFDQMRGDYLVKWKPLFGEGGFKRLEAEGAFFTNCHYPYSDTLTAAGHTSLATGTTPSQHGIVANDWFDRKEGRLVASTTGERGPTPDRRRKETFSDLLEKAHKGKSKSAGLSIKERAAILMAAFRAQIVYWLSRLGEFETSQHYRPDPHSWVTQYNKSGKIKSWVDKDWNRLHDKLDYEQISGPDDVPFEGTGYEQGRTFPHPTPGVGALENSPWGNELLLDFFKLTVEKEKLGQRGVPDFIGISFSSNDLIGHCYGPDSQEVLDVTLRSDRTVKEMLDFLDEKVGKGKYIVALSADHGVCPLPELSKGRGEDAERFSTNKLMSDAENFLHEKYNAGNEKVIWFESEVVNWFYLQQKTLDALKLPKPEVERALADWVKTHPRVQASFTRTELSSLTPLAEPIAEQARLSFHPDCSGDVNVILKPYNLLWKTSVKKIGPYATTHGSPHPYDTHVPLIVMGPGIKPGIYEEKVVPQILPRIFCRLTEIEPAASMTYAPPEGIFAK